MPDDPWGEPERGLVIGDSLETVPARLRKVLEAAEDNGWEMSKTGCTAVLRLHRPADEVALPFYVRWDLLRIGKEGKEGKLSWRYHSAMAQNGQKLNYNDVFDYIEHPEYIHPEPPEERDK